jgi:hypothetical protein
MPVCSHPVSASDTTAAAGGAIALGALGVAGGVMFAVGSTSREKGVPMADAEIYVSRYNHALLRKIEREAQGKTLQGKGPRMHVEPVESPGFIGLRGVL